MDVCGGGGVGSLSGDASRARGWLFSLESRSRLVEFFDGSSVIFFKWEFANERWRTRWF